MPKELILVKITTRLHKIETWSSLYVNYLINFLVEPQAASPPTNLTEGETILTKNKLSVTMHWLPPKKSDLPVIRYKVDFCCV